MSRKKKKPQVLILLVVAFLAVLFFSLDIGGFLRPVRSGADVVLNPVRYWFSNQSRTVSTFFRDLSSISSLRQKNNDLQIEVYDLESSLAEFNSIRNENDFLREQLNLPERESYEIVHAHIIGGDFKVSTTGSFIIDKGGSSGVKKDDVVAYANFFIGVVTDTTDNSAVVEMISGGKLNIPAIAENNRTKGIVTGDVNTGLVMEKVLREEKLHEGERILTSGIGGFPKDLILGEVVRIEGEDSDIEKRALLERLIEIQSIENVIVINVKKD